MKKQTAVEWLVEQLIPKAMSIYDTTTYNVIEKAKAMEREQDHIGDVNEMIVPDWVYDNLCYYDLRNPNGIKDYLEEEYGYSKEEMSKIGNHPRKGCACDNCFYRRSKMAEFIIKNKII